MLSPEGNPSASYRVNWQRLDDFGLEYRYISRYLRGSITYDEMKELIKKESWQYAKRQMTWFRRDNKIHWITKPTSLIPLVKDFLKHRG